MSLTAALAVLASSDTLEWVGQGAPSDAEAVASLFATAFDGAYAVEPHGSESMSLVHLDTVDARVKRAGRHVVYCPARGALVAMAPDETPVEQVVGKARFPAELPALPEGPVRSLLARAVWVRALVPYASTKVTGRTFSLLNTDAKTVARITWWTSVLAGSQSLQPRIHIAALRGYESDAKKATRLLGTGDGVHRPRRSWFADLPAGPAPLGGEREPVKRPAMTANQPSATAVATALLGFLDELEANVAGALDDVDTEFLHDLRVAVRRTRSILKLLGDALPEGMAARVVPEFRWLGQITTPTRDLDVYLLGVDDMAASITSPNDLVPFAAHLRRRRNAVRRELVRELRSRRFADLRESWRADLERVIATDPRDGSPTVRVFANDRLHRTFRTVRKRAAAISAESPAEDIHTLRKKCKELRYLLEVFAPILDRRAYKQVIGDFKELQQVLGEFQDGEVQALALRTFAQEMIDQGGAPAAALLAMGDLAARFDERQRHARSRAHRTPRRVPRQTRRSARRPAVRVMKTIASYNVKGGVGKTSAAVNLAYLSARGGAPHAAVGSRSTGRCDVLVPNQAEGEGRQPQARRRVTADARRREGHRLRRSGSAAGRLHLPAHGHRPQRVCPAGADAAQVAAPAGGRVRRRRCSTCRLACRWCPRTS